MTTTPHITDPVQALLDRLDGVKAEGNAQWSAKCPSHEDRVQSLSVSRGNDGRCLIFCHAGCQAREIVEKLGLKVTDLFPRAADARSTGKKSPSAESEAKGNSQRQIVETYDYTDKSGALLFQVVRYDPKGFSQRRPDHQGDWIWNLKGVQRVLYRLQELTRASDDCVIYVCEGEKDADRLAAEGLIATTCPQGAGKWGKVDDSILHGRHVVIVPHNDKAGRQHAQDIAKALHGKAKSVRIVELPNPTKSGYDVSDYLDAGNDPADLDQLAAKAKEWEPAEPSTIEPPDSFRLTDTGNAERLVAQHGNDLRFSRALGWLCWDGRRWKRDDTGEAERRAKRTVRELYNEAASLDDADKRQALAKWAKSSESAARRRNLLDLAKCEAVIVATPGELDRDDFLLNVKNGTINLRTGKLTPHNRADLITKLAPVEYDPDATCPTFLRFIDETVCGRKPLSRYLQEFFGMCLSGDISEQILFIGIGVGSNGKNTLIDQMTDIWGDYAAEAAPELLVEQKHRAHPTEIADLLGKRLVIASETERNEHLRVQFVKRLTGDARLKGRFMHKDFFEFRRTCKVILITNNKPVISEQTHAIWRRLRLIPFDNIVANVDQDKALPDKLRAESSGILAWLIQGCLAWKRHGLATPQEVLVATAAYRTDSDWIGRFADECLTLAPELWSPSFRISDTLDVWCHEVGVEADMPALREYLRRNQCVPKSTRQGRGWAGIGIVSNLEVPD